MLRRGVVMVCAVAVGLGSVRVQADNWIVEWGGTSNCYDIFQEGMEIVITGAGTYKFAAEDTHDPDGLGVINKISVVYDPNVPGCTVGPVYVYVTKRNDVYNNGAAEVWEIDLSGATEGYIVTVRARDSIADLGDVVATDIVDRLKTWSIVHNVALSQFTGAISATEMANLTVWGDAMGQVVLYGPYAGTIQIYGDAGTLLLASLPTGSVAVTGNMWNFQTIAGFEGHAHFGSLYWFRVGQAGYGGEFGPLGALVVDGDLTGYLHVYGGALAGTVTISGNVTPDAAIATPYGPLSGTVQVGYLDGPVYVGAGSAADLTGSVTVDHDMTGLVSINGNLTGELAIGGTLLPEGLIDIGGEMPYPSHVQVGGHFQGTLNTDALAGSIHIGADMSGLIDVVNYIGDNDPNHPFGGHIRVNGGFRAYEGGPAPRIEAYDMVSPRSYITFDYDASNDPWEAGAEVVFEADPEPYVKNTPSARIWHSVYCLGDMNNDGNINSADGTPFGTGPFFLALTNPAQYALNFPGLGEANPEWDPINPQSKPRFISGPVLFHGNCNCDMVFDWGDRRAFLDLVSSHACTNCEGQDELSRMPPEELASEIVANVDPEILADAPALMQETIDLYSDQPEAQEYWQAVQENVGP